MVKPNIKYLIAGAITGALGAAPLTSAVALTNRYHHTHCKTVPGDVYNYDVVEGYSSIEFTGEVDIDCPISETSTFQKANVTGATVFYRQTGTSQVAAKLCTLEITPTSPSSSSTCSSALLSNPDLQGYLSMSFSSSAFATWDNHPNAYPYIHVTLPSATGQPTGTKYSFRGIELTY